MWNGKDQVALRRGKTLKLKAVIDDPRIITPTGSSTSTTPRTTSTNTTPLPLAGEDCGEDSNFHRSRSKERFNPARRRGASFER